MIKEQSIQSVLEASRVEEVVGDFVNLKKRGVNLIGLCPFHSEKTPSFTVSPNKGIYKCFGCGQAGNSAKFLMEHEQMSFPEAIRSLAKRYQIALEETENREEESAEKLHKESLMIVMEFAKKFFSDQLLKDEVGRSVGLSYFKHRGYNEELVKKFDLGFAPDSYDSLLQAGKKAGYNPNLMREVGLVSLRNEKFLDFFRNRVQFTIHNLSGKPIAFAGRILQTNTKAPKYLNSPETEIYHKSNILYGIYQARNAIRKEDACIMVEGYTDVLSVHQSGIEHVVASSGTSLTDGQIKLVKRFTSNLVFLYDGDPAGVKAAMRGLELVLEQDMNVRIVVLPEGQDPDSYAQEHGGDGLREYIDQHALDFILFKAGLLAKDAKNDPIKKAALVNDIVGSIARIPDPIKRSIYIQQCAAQMSIDEQLLINATNKVKRERLRKQIRHKDDADQLERRYSEEREHHQQEVETVNPNQFQEKHVTKLLLEYGDREIEPNVTVAQHIFEGIEAIDFVEHGLCKAILQYGSELYKKGQPITSTVFINHENTQLSEFAIDLMSFPYVFSENWDKKYEILVPEPESNFIKDVRYGIDRFLFKRIIQMLEENALAMKDLETDADIRKRQQVQMALHEKRKVLSERLGGIVVVR